jgi:Zn-dependent protease with chaperone function
LTPRFVRVTSKIISPSMDGDSTVSPDYSILAAFQAPIQRPRTSFAYHCGLVLAAGIMALLLAAYVALAGLLAYGLWYYAVHYWKVMLFGVLGLFVYFLLLFVGVIVLVFMLRPIFAGRPKRAMPIALNPAQEPLIYALIEKICDTVGAPSPQRIELDCQLNAAAGFRRGLFSFLGNDLVLVIGLPLVASSSARELAGVVAHELGHFTQSAGMRLSYVVRHITFWFFSAAYRRDRWDVVVERASRDANGDLTLVGMIIQPALSLSRLVPKLFMFIGLGTTGFMSRQMEYNADAYEIKVSGSDVFEQGERRRATLNAAMTQADAQLIALWRKARTLPDNLPEVIRQCHDQLSPAVLRKIDDTLGLWRTHLFASHPSPADRIRRARQAADPGIFHDDRPASSLFMHFDDIARSVTIRHYTVDLGLPIEEDKLLQVKSSSTSREQSIRDQYFFGLLPLMTPLRLSAMPASDPKSASAELERISATLPQIAEQAAPVVARFENVREQVIEIRAEAIMRQTGVFEAHSTFTAVLHSGDEEAQCVAELDALRRFIVEPIAALTARLELGLALRLSGRGDGNGAIPVEQIHELTASLSQAALEHAQQQAVMDALRVLDRILVLGGGSLHLAVSRAIDAQIEVLNGLVAPLIPVEEVPRKSGLQIAKRPQRINMNMKDVEAVRQKTLDWFADYHERIERLCQIAQAAEGVSTAG